MAPPFLSDPEAERAAGVTGIAALVATLIAAVATTTTTVAVATATAIATATTSLEGVQIFEVEDLAERGALGDAELLQQLFCGHLAVEAEGFEIFRRQASKSISSWLGCSTFAASTFSVWALLSSPIFLSHAGAFGQLAGLEVLELLDATQCTRRSDLPVSLMSARDLRLFVAIVSYSF